VQPIGVSVDPTTKVPTYTFNGTQTKTFNYDASLCASAIWTEIYILVYSKISKALLKRGLFYLLI
jgi:hypothetical protein